MCYGVCNNNFDCIRTDFCGAAHVRVQQAWAWTRERNVIPVSYTLRFFMGRGYLYNALRACGMGASWLGYAGVAFFIMLLLAAVLPPSPPRPKSNPQLTAANDMETESEIQAVFSITFGIFFWILIITLLIIGLAGAFYSGEPKIPEPQLN